MPDDPELTPCYTTFEVAEALRVTPTTVRRWLAKGLLVGIRLPNGEYRIPAEALSQFVGAAGIPTSSGSRR